MELFDKEMVSYAIAMHLRGKNLIKLDYISEAKTFLQKALFIT